MPEHEYLERISNDIIERLTAKQLKLPASPEIVLRVNALLNDDTKGLSDIATAMESHQTLAARILQVVNSPALRPAKPITSLHTALSILGIALVKNLAISIAIREMFKSKNFELKALLEATWFHSVEVGYLSSVYVSYLDDRRYDPNTALVIGILHSIGSLPIIDYFEQEKIPVDKFKAVEAELANDISTSLVKEWGLPISFQEALRGTGLYGSILKYVHAYLDKQEYDSMLMPFDEFEKIVNDNKDNYVGLVSVYR